MTIRECLEQVSRVKPNVIDLNTAILWANQIDKSLYNSVILTHEGAEEYEEPDYTSVDDEMLAKAPYNMMYVYFFMSMIDFQNQEIALYQNSSALYNQAVSEWRNWYNRLHMPLSVAALHYTGHKHLSKRKVKADEAT